MDDDVRVLQNYFEKVLELFDKNPEVVNLGGYVINQKSTSGNMFLRKLALLDGKKSGVILKSGFATLPNPRCSATKTKWIPGLSQNVRMSVFRKYLFDGRIRMYGEDLEFCLRIAEIGDILCSNELPVRHLAATEERDGIRNTESFTDGFRWSLAQKKQSGVTKRAVIYSTAVLTIAEFFVSLIRLESLHLNKAMGHIDFFSRLIRGKEVQQKVEHAGSGPEISR